MVDITINVNRYEVIACVTERPKLLCSCQISVTPLMNCKPTTKQTKKTLFLLLWVWILGFIHTNASIGNKVSTCIQLGQRIPYMNQALAAAPLAI